ncbi:NAD(+) kinase [Sulfurovum sp. enrichment culture clone C5]|uniref:NAD kinase n=1 Tax=Sulfurovum sp. enrichment culture clone C5 TaxID=497650 RepID=A0A0S4XMR4_9BACT|nr:NAD(+) kinase [Sulfurovum sp. enrichment culture clone C5]
MTKLLEKIDTFGFTLKPNEPEIKIIFNNVKKLFEKYGLKVLLSKESAEMIGESGISFDDMCKESDVLVSLGGDGSLLSLVRRSYKHKKPVFGINAGSLGFLADVSLDNVEKFIKDLISQNYRIDERMMIEGIIKSTDGKRSSFFAFNDVVLTRSAISKMVKVNASIDDKWFNTYRGDGLIVSTPTGSTAYNLAVGGPVMYPLTHAFIMTPISAHSLTQRPLVVPGDFTIELTSPDENNIAVIDGQDDYELKPDDILIIKGAKRGARLIHSLERNYFDVLREKLHWGDKR